MISSIASREFLKAKEGAITSSLKNGTRKVKVEGKAKEVRYPFPSPADWRDCPIYFLMIDRFNNPDKPPKERWDSVYGYHQGGTFNGVRAALPYLSDLGIKAIWITPVFRNPKPENWKYNYHGYAAQNFLEVDNRFGTEKELEEMVTEAHYRGIYVILDIVLNHTGRVFDYVWQNRVTDNFTDAWLLNAPLGSEPPVRWLNGYGFPREDWENIIPAGTALSPDDAVYPDELRNHLFFRRRGSKNTDKPDHRGFVPGDFGSMRQLVVEYDAKDDQQLRDRLGRMPVLNLLISCYQYLVARYDFDGFRMDTVKYVHPDMIQTFGNAIREFALGIGKKNFFTFGEIYDDEKTIAQFVGRNGSNNQGFGIDSALDFPLFYKLPQIAKALNSAGVEDIREIYEKRKEQEKELLTSHGEASRFFITFLDNHDQHERFNHPLTDTKQVTLGITLLFCLQGIPCLYYGTEQGLTGTKNTEGNPDFSALESVREALWGKPGGFDKNNSFYRAIQQIAEKRHFYPELRYGRLYFREVSGNGIDFGLSWGSGGLVVFSRILFDSEILVAANTSTTTTFDGHILIDRDINRGRSESSGPGYSILYSNLGTAREAKVRQGEYHFWDRGNHTGQGMAASLPVVLKPMEVQILGIKIL